jgi:hypothetical protein
MIYRHGKDNKLIVWKLRDEDAEDMSKALPVDDASTARKQPWIVHILDVRKTFQIRTFLP